MHLTAFGNSGANYCKSNLPLPPPPAQARVNEVFPRSRCCSAEFWASSLLKEERLRRVRKPVCNITKATTFILKENE